ncbi:MAG: competence protein ComEA [Blastocatellia bacterium]|jgi:competence ComEA-like helix-hairpin-helix protein|nr:competence protein ComEA [Blastocatellia bacterium]
MKHNLGGNTRALTFLLVIAAVASVAACVRLPRNPINKPAILSASVNSDGSKRKQIDINTAPVGELEKLPGVGKSLAARIVQHRENFGPFRRVEHLLAVRGISDKKFRAMQPFLTIEQ